MNHCFWGSSRVSQPRFCLHLGLDWWWWVCVCTHTCTFCALWDIEQYPCLCLFDSSSTAHTPHPTCDNQKYLQVWPDVPWGVKWPPSESLGWGLIIMGCKCKSELSSKFFTYFDLYLQQWAALKKQSNNASCPPSWPSVAWRGLHVQSLPERVWTLVIVSL